MTERDIIVRKFEELTLNELYGILRSRQEVFAIEQGIVYQDMDLIDQKSVHLFIPEENGNEINAYLRIIPPDVKYAETSMGRLLTLKNFRNRGVGRKLMLAGIQEAEKLYGKPIRIEAQAYLLKFYQSLGFKAISEPFILEGINHIEMILT